ncbi:MAG: recombinase family protein [Defluviitaleaceae bacterium]|nr:recombinase family protein [Defluviitaleaceae bacterium]
MSAQRVVTAIPASVNRFTAVPIINGRKKRVAGYARVSTDEEEQQTSYEAQVDHYTRHIQSNPDWEYVDVYADEGISATSMKRRDGFNRMIADALAGKIDLIITKSVSRFAQNTVDTLTTVRNLKEKGVEVYFEKENILTLDSKGELLITIMSSLAQDESRNISENTTWGKRKLLADGKIILPYAHFLGYEKGEDGLPKIVESEAKIVRLIYTMYLQGKTHNVIARHLTEQGIPTPAGKQKWSVSTVMSILQNEKYKGDSLQQKHFTVDFLSKKVKKNEGEVQQFYVENSHPAVVEPEVFDLVQAEIKRRKESGRQRTGLHAFSSKIICGECGGFFSPKTWHSNSKYKRTIWQCGEKYKIKGKCPCQTPHLNEATVQQIFVRVFNQVYQNKARIIADHTEIIKALTDTSTADHESDALREECRVVAEMIQQCVNENARIAQDQTEYQKRYAALHDRYDAAKTQLDKIASDRQERATKREIILRFLADLEQQNGTLTEFDEQLWYATVESITVHSESNIAITFKNGGVENVDARKL